MSSLEPLLRLAREKGASDLHIEAGLPPALRIRGQLSLLQEPISAASSLSMAKQLIGDRQWSSFIARRSFDCSRTLQGIRCRINIFQTSRGVGLAVRLLSSFEASIERLNLQPSLKRLTTIPHGLILVCGPTGSGKSTTMAALIEEINRSEARHIITLESPIEYAFRPRKSFIRQREVGRDTPSFEQALLDAMREDPDVLMVGEMREASTMQLTLNAAETGHLVFSTLHSSSASEALQRMISAFPSEIHSGVSSQLADSLRAVVCQRLRYFESLDLRVPECEILIANDAVKNIIRQGNFFKIASVLETSARDGSWSFARYREWLERRTNWHFPPEQPQSPTPAWSGPAAPTPDEVLPPLPPPSASKPRHRNTPPAKEETPDDVLVLDEHDDSLEEIISQLKKL